MAAAGEAGEEAADGEAEADEGEAVEDDKDDAAWLDEGLDPPHELDMSLYTKRQRALLGEDPERYKRFFPRLSRRERGGYNDPEAAEEFDVEVRAHGWRCTPHAWVAGEETKERVDKRLRGVLGGVEAGGAAPPPRRRPPVLTRCPRTCPASPLRTACRSSRMRSSPPTSPFTTSAPRSQSWTTSS